jgi:hypothetical protein
MDSVTPKPVILIQIVILLQDKVVSMGFVVYLLVIQVMIVRMVVYVAKDFVNRLV